MAKDTKSKTAYIEAVGRRKQAIARVRIIPESKTHYVVNDKDLATYFPVVELQQTIESPLKIVSSDTFSVSAHIVGGGVVSQAEAFRHGIARALLKHDPALRGKLKAEGFLTRDARVKERKKFGLKKARKAAQWSKR
jgi:small subunit ribosomal protein S9